MPVARDAVDQYVEAVVRLPLGDEGREWREAQQGAGIDEGVHDLDSRRGGVQGLLHYEAPDELTRGVVDGNACGRYLHRLIRAGASASRTDLDRGSWELGTIVSGNYQLSTLNFQLQAACR